MQKLAIEGLYMWSVWQSDRNVHFNSYFYKYADTNIAVDPLAWLPEDEAEMLGFGGVAWIVVTNRDHERRTHELAQSFGAKIAASEQDAPLLACAVDRKLKHGEEIVPGLRVIALEGLKSPGEIALHFEERRVAIVGDALWGDPAGSVRLLRDDKLLDPKAAVRSLRRLWALRLKTLLVGDGANIYADADRVIGEYLQSRSDVFVNRINIDELEGEPESYCDGKFAATFREVGFLIGARKLGYQVSTIPPGARFCPMHGHLMEEEMFLVWEGEPTIRMNRGEFVCRRGDLIAFPTGDAGTHQLVNNSDKPCTVLMLCDYEPNEVCWYPDSKKIMIDGRDRLIVRSEPALDYFDGE